MHGVTKGPFQYQRCAIRHHARSTSREPLALMRESASMLNFNFSTMMVGVKKPCRGLKFTVSM